MKRFIVCCIIALLCLSCGVSKKTIETTPTQRMLALIDAEFTKYQFDSLCVADSLPNDLKKWLYWEFIDYEDNKTIKEFIYIKKVNEDDIMYRVIVDDNYNVMKRLTDR